MNRRNWLKAAGAAVMGLWVSACDRLTRNPKFMGFIGSAENLNRQVQRTVTDRQALAREFPASMISPDFRANGTRSPVDADYVALRDAGFADYRLVIDGLVERPLSLSLTDLRAEPARTQITRHDCVEGWSSIGKWTGAKLGPLLDKAGLKPQARYLVFHCADTLGEGPNGRYYESIDLVDARHPQTILAYDMNDRPLPVAHGAPLRLRVERQLGYKHAKYVTRIEAVESFALLHGGKGGFWEDRGYEWYAGI